MLNGATTGAWIDAIRAEIRELNDDVSATTERAKVAKENVLRFQMRQQMLAERLTHDEVQVLKALAHDFQEELSQCDRELVELRARRSLYEAELADFREIVRRFGAEEFVSKPEVRDALQVAKQIRQVVAEANSKGTEGS